MVEKEINELKHNWSTIKKLAKDWQGFSVIVLLPYVPHLA